jgi:hypothetical protein
LLSRISFSGFHRMGNLLKDHSHPLYLTSFPMKSIIRAAESAHSPSFQCPIPAIG